jgi:hypothetical protein
VSWSAAPLVETPADDPELTFDDEPAVELDEAPAEELDEPDEEAPPVLSSWLKAVGKQKKVAKATVANARALTLFKFII